jgi:hypothetical protein
MQAKAKEEKQLSDDVLFGAPAIAQFVGLSERQVYHQQKNLRLKKLGAILVGSRKRLTELLTGEAT